MGLVMVNNNPSSSSGASQEDVILKIDNMAVNKETRTNYNTIEVDDLIWGEYPVGSGRFITARVTKQPWNENGDDNNLRIISIDEP